MKKLAIFLIAGILLSVAGATAYTDYLRNTIEYKNTGMDLNDQRTVGSRPVEVIATVSMYSDGGETSAVQVLVDGEELTRVRYGTDSLSKGTQTVPVTFKVSEGSTYEFNELSFAGDMDVDITVKETEL